MRYWEIGGEIRRAFRQRAEGRITAHRNLGWLGVLGILLGRRDIQAIGLGGAVDRLPVKFYLSGNVIDAGRDATGCEICREKRRENRECSSDQQASQEIAAEAVHRVCNPRPPSSE